MLLRHTECIFSPTKIYTTWHLSVSKIDKKKYRETTNTCYCVIQDVNKPDCHIFVY